MPGLPRPTGPPPAIRIERDLSALSNLFSFGKAVAPQLLAPHVQPVTDAIGSKLWEKLSVSIVVGGLTVARVEDAAGPASPGKTRTDGQGPSLNGELWYVLGGYCIHDDAAKNIAVGLAKMISGTKYDVELFCNLGQSTSNPYAFPRPFVIDWNSRLYVSANGARMDTTGPEAPAALAAGKKICFRYCYVPLQVGEHLEPI